MSNTDGIEYSLDSIIEDLHYKDLRIGELIIDNKLMINDFSIIKQLLINGNPIDVQLILDIISQYIEVS